MEIKTRHTHTTVKDKRRVKWGGHKRTQWCIEHFTMEVSLLRLFISNTYQFSHSRSRERGENRERDI